MAAPTKVGGWLRGPTTVRRGGTTSGIASRSSSVAAVPQVAGTSTNIYSGGVKDASGKTQEFSAKDDQCPVCKSDRYLNPKLRLLVSSCYHKMCESCIDRLFTLGPAPCPVCNKIQRKMAFAPQTFEDLTVEKEVAIRRRIHKEFNKRREDFVDLKSYNDYLEEIEDITFNLINEVNIPETEARIAQHRAENAALIELNLQREELDLQGLQEEEERERAEREERARELRKEEEMERDEREKEKRELIDRLQTSDAPAAKVVAKSRAEALKRSSLRSVPAALPRSSSQLLRSRAAASGAVPDVPHVPLSDDWWDYTDKFVLRDDYDDPAHDFVRQDPDGIVRAGGYRIEDSWQRAIISAVAGLDLRPLESADVVMASA